MTDHPLLSLLIEAEALARETALTPGARLRTGKVESLWHFRPYQGGEAIQTIDWKQTARGDQILVRWPEPTKLRPLYLWKASGWAKESEEQRATLLLAALGFMLLKAERTVSWLAPGLATQHTTSLFQKHLYEALAHQAKASVRLPPLEGMPRESLLVLAGDASLNPQGLRQRLEILASRKNRGLLIDFADGDSPLQVCADRFGWPLFRASAQTQPQALLLEIYREALQFSAASNIDRLSFAPPSPVLTSSLEV